MRRPRSWLLMAWMVVVAACQGGPQPSASSASTLPREDLLILMTSKTALPPATIAAGDLPAPNSPEAALLVKYCTQCHALPSPTMHASVDWPVVLRRMWLRMDRLPDSLGIQIPDPSERIAMLGYFNLHALRVSGATLPEGPGQETFSMVCSRCHALPHPRDHSPQDWPAVVTRQFENMDRMNVTRPTAEETEQILGYLRVPRL